MPAQTVPANGTATAPAYKPNLLDMGRAFTREFVSAGLGFMVFMGLFNSVNAQTHLPMKLLGRFAPQTAKFPLPFLGPIRMNWLGAAINIGGGFLLMPVISNLLLKMTDAIIGKPQYIKVEEATKKMEEAKHKQEELLKKQQKQQQGVAGLPAGFNSAGLTMPPQLPTTPLPLPTTPEQYGVLGNMALNANRGRSGQ
jgi:TRAP-type C4-dicarboxylate transport system permease small subunit